jgi:hypothetical protein
LQAIEKEIKKVIEAFDFDDDYTPEQNWKGQACSKHTGIQENTGDKLSYVDGPD